MKVQIAPSILSADFARLSDALAVIEKGGADVVHVDVMDGHFVPNITIGVPVVKSLRKATQLPLDCHLMIEEPQRYIDDFLAAGANWISVHIEAERHMQRALQMIRDGGARAGVAINPATTVSALTDVLDYCDFVLVMSVNPGFGGQKFLKPSTQKIREIAGMIESRRLSVSIEVDGGIDPSTAPEVTAAGAGILVAGSAVFGKPDPARAIADLRSAATSLVA